MTSRYVLFSPPVLLTNGHIYYFLITALRDAQFSRENSAIFHVGGEEGALLCVCSTARFFDTATHRKDWKEEQVESALSIHCFFFLSKKKCAARVSLMQTTSLWVRACSAIQPLFFFACCSALFFFFLLFSNLFSYTSGFLSLFFFFSAFFSSFLFFICLLEFFVLKSKEWSLTTSSSLFCLSRFSVQVVEQTPSQLALISFFLLA